jgi:hypothetical protein
MFSIALMPARNSYGAGVPLPSIRTQSASVIAAEPL